MTTPNIEELIAELRQLANEIEISYRIESIEEAVKALQSQAERIKELERESETHSKAYGLAIVERDNLRAQLAEIAATEPVYYLGGGRLYGDKTSALFDNAKNAITELFTRPMPAQDVTELVEALEEYGRAGVGNSTDWRVQLSALRLATAALSKYKGAK